jgi:tight adherence protein C
MKFSILIPTLFAASGAFWLAIGANPQTEFRNRVANSRDRKSVQFRLSEIGKSEPKEFEVFRSRQLLFSLVSFLSVFIFLLIRRSNFLLLLVLPAIFCVGTFVMIDRNLSKLVSTHRTKVDSEFPAIIEMYSLAMSAGETPLSAMDRISKTAHGSLAIEFSKVVLSVRTGQPFHVALDEMGRNLDSLLIRRFVDSLVVATLRGASVIEVLQRHAEEAREFQRNRVLGAAAKAEISMMIPVVFLILPVSILFALWPSLANLNSFAGG